MPSVIVEKVVLLRGQKPSRVVLDGLYSFRTDETRLRPQAHEFRPPDPFFLFQQKPSLLVVLGNGPLYNVNVDALRRPPSRVFVTQEVTSFRRSWQTAPFGAAQYGQDVQRWPQQKVFQDPQVFAQSWMATPRSTTDFIQSSADIFHGQDTYGWPPDPYPAYFSPEGRGTETLLNSFAIYPYGTDIVGRRGNAIYFAPQDTFFRAAQSAQTPRSLSDLYNAATDVTRLRPTLKYFQDPDTFWRRSMPLTGNILKFFPVYNPTTDVTRLKPQARHFEEFVPFWRGQIITINALIFLPPIGPPPWVQCVAAGYYMGIYRNIGDVFQLNALADLSSSLVNYYPNLTPNFTADSPVYGWMKPLQGGAPTVIIASEGLVSAPKTMPRRTVL